MLFGAGALISLRDVKKKRRHRLGSQSSQNVALGRRELIVRTLAQETRAPAINAASVEKMSQVLLGFAEPILDRLAPLDEKKAMLFFAITDYCMISSEEQRHMRWELRHILNNAHNRAHFEDAHPAQNGTLPAQPAAIHGSRSDRDCRQAAR